MKPRWFLAAGGAAILLSGTILYLVLSRQGSNATKGEPAALEKRPAIAVAPGDSDTMLLQEAFDRADALGDEALPSPGGGDSAEPSHAAGSFLGRVLNGESGRPLSREQLNVVLRQAHSSRPMTVTTDGEGRFRLRGLLPGLYSLETRHSDYLADLRWVGLTDPEPAGQRKDPEEVEIRLAPASKLEGEVLDPSGKPVAGANVRLSSLQGGPDNAATKTDGEGLFSISGLRPGKWKVLAFLPGYRRGSLEVEVPSQGRARLLLAKDPGLDVLVKDPQGAPLPLARVSLSSRSEGFLGAHRSGVTTTDGKIHLDGFAGEGDGKVLITVSHKDFLSEEKVVTEEEGSRGLYEVTLSPGANVSGRVLDGAGRPASGAQVELFRQEPSVGESSVGPFRQLKTAADGAFQLKKVPAGKYDLSAVTPLLGSAVPSEVEVSASNVEGLEVRLQPGEGVLAGRVRDAEGKGVARCPVTLTPERHVEGHARQILRTVSGQDGTFRFEGLSISGAMTYQVTAAGRHSTSATESGVPVGRMDVELLTRQMGSISGLAAAEGPLTSYLIQLKSEDPPPTGDLKERTFRFSSRDLWFHLKDIAPGAYTVSLIIENELRAEAKDVRVIPGQETGPVKLGAK